MGGCCNWRELEKYQRESHRVMLKLIEDRIRYYSYECFFGFDYYGSLVSRAYGDVDTVCIPARGLELLEGGTDVHNHVTDASFSSCDLRTFANYHLRESRVVSPRWTFSIKRQTLLDFEKDIQPVYEEAKKYVKTNKFKKSIICRYPNYNPKNILDSSRAVMHQVAKNIKYLTYTEDRIPLKIPKYPYDNSDMAHTVTISCIDNEIPLICCL